MNQDEYIAAHKKRRENFEASVAETLKDHQYTALADAPGIQVWRCAQPGRSCYAFDITMTRYGIAVMGDIDGLVFRVGISYGFEFLAGDDVDYYIHSKLEERSKERELDVDDFRGVIIAGICGLLVNEAPDDEGFEALPEWVRDEQKRGPDGSRWDDLKTLVRAKGDAYKYTGEDGQIDWQDIDTLVSRADDAYYLQEADDLRRDHYEELNLGGEWWDHDVSRPSHSLIERLYMVRHAAKQILAIKTASAEQVA